MSNPMADPRDIWTEPRRPREGHAVQQASLPEPPITRDWERQRQLAGISHTRAPLRRVTLRMWLASLLRSWADRLDP